MINHVALLNASRVIILQKNDDKVLSVIVRSGKIQESLIGDLFVLGECDFSTFVQAIENCDIGDRVFLNELSKLFPQYKCQNRDVRSIFIK